MRGRGLKSAVAPTRLAMVAVWCLMVWGSCADLAAAIITVGPHGQVQEVGQAVTLALASSGNDQIRIEPGVYDENLDFSLGAGSGDLTISGGWDELFSTRTNDPSLTILDGGQRDRVASVALESTVLFIMNMTVRNGSADGMGGGMALDVSGGEAFVYDILFLDNEAVSGPSQGAKGGGLHLHLNGGGYAEVDDNSFLRNRIRVADAENDLAVQGGAFYATLSVGTNTDLEFANNYLEGNACERNEEVGTAQGCSVYIVLSQPNSDLTFRANTIADTRVQGFAQVNPVAGFFQMGNTSSGLLESNLWDGLDLDTSHLGGSVLVVSLINGSEAVQRSSLITGGFGAGMQVFASAADWSASNLTIVDSGDVGLSISGDASSTLDLANTIVVGHASFDLYVGGGTSLNESANVIGIDPGFVNRESGYYQLAKDSPAVDTGDMSPVGGLSPRDVSGDLRIQGAAVDIGAHEGTSMIFADNFESGLVSGWS